MLDVDSVDRDIADYDVAVGNVGDEARGVEVGFYPCSVLGIEDLTIGELIYLAGAFQI